MSPSPSHRRSFRRVFGALLTCALVAAALSPAVAKDKHKGPTQKDLKNAQHEYNKAAEQAKQLTNTISHTRARVDSLRGEVESLKGEVKIAQVAYDKIAEKLAETEDKQGAFQVEYDDVNTIMADRTRTAYIAGPTGGLDVLLNSTSLADMSARSTFLNSLQAQDANTSRRLHSLSHDLQGLKHDQRIQSKEAEGALKEVQNHQDELHSKVTEQAAALNELAHELHTAQMLEKKWGLKVETISKKLNTVVVGGPGPFYACPVPKGSVGDDFGDIRYTTSPPHYHAGNDIIAPMGAEIYAPFNGVASDSSDSLGGNTVTVHGKDGYVYNAHLSKYGKQGRVNAGDVIGYVGETGDAQGTVPHDHFEWHPNNTGGERTINGAIDPHPYLLAVCN